MEIPEWGRFAAEFRLRKSESITEAVELAGLDVQAFEALLAGRCADEGELCAGWRAAADLEFGPVLLAAYLYVRCHQAWELSVDYERIGGAIGKIREAWREAGEPGGPHPAYVRALIGHAESLTGCMAVENALQCSCPRDLERQAAEVSDRSRRLLAALPSPEPETEDVHGFVGGLLRIHEVAYSAVAEIGAAVTAVLLDPADVRPLDQAIASARRGERHDAVRGDATESELRSHRYGLIALRDRMGRTSIPRIAFTEAGFIYLYPFTFAEGHQNTELGGLTEPLHVAKAAGRTLAGQVPVDIRQTELSDLWYWGHFDRPSYGGLTIAMPDMSLTTLAGLTIEPYQVEIRLNNLGNHYVRIAGPRGEMDLHAMYQGLRRGSRYMGEERIHHEGDGRHPRLREYAMDLITDLGEVVGRPVRADVDDDAHIVLEIRAADVDGRDATADDLLRAAGPLLLQPVQSLSASLEEWARNPVPQTWLDPLDGCAFADSLGVRTDNTTVLFTPGAPNWAWIEFGEIAELAASVRALFRLWRDQIWVMLQHVKTTMEGHLNTPELRAESEGALDDLRRELGVFMAGVRMQRGMLHSGDLLESIRHRRMLDNLFAASDMRRAEAGLDAHMAELGALYDLLGTYLRSLRERELRDQERSTRHYQQVVELVLAGVAVLSFADALSLVNDLFFSPRPVSVLAWSEMGVFAVLATAVVVMVAWAKRRA